METADFDINLAHIECALQSRTGIAPDETFVRMLAEILDHAAVLSAAEKGGEDFSEVCELAYDEIYEQSLAIA